MLLYYNSIKSGELAIKNVPPDEGRLVKFPWAPLDSGHLVKFLLNDPNRAAPKGILLNDPHRAGRFQ